MDEACPICERTLIVDSWSREFGKSHCEHCPYEFHGNGSYAVIAIINDEQFDLEDGWGDEIKFEERVQEMKRRLVLDKANWPKEGF